MDNEKTLSGCGGKREGAGRKKEENPAKIHSIRLSDEDYLLFNKKGGVKWLREQLHK